MNKLHDKPNARQQRGSPTRFECTLAVVINQLMTALLGVAAALIYAWEIVVLSRGPRWVVAPSGLYFPDVAYAVALLPAAVAVLFTVCWLVERGIAVARWVRWATTTPPAKSAKYPDLFRDTGSPSSWKTYEEADNR